MNPGTVGHEERGTQGHDDSFCYESVTFQTLSLNVNGAPAVKVISYVHINFI